MGFKEELLKLGIAEDVAGKVVGMLENELNELKKQFKDSDDLQDTIKSLQDTIKSLKNTNKQQKEQYESQIASQKRDFAIDQELIKNNARNMKAVKSLLKLEDIEFNEETGLSGLKEQLDNLKKSDAYLFDNNQKFSYGLNPANNNQPINTSQAMNSFIRMAAGKE